MDFMAYPRTCILGPMSHPLIRCRVILKSLMLVLKKTLEIRYSTR